MKTIQCAHPPHHHNGFVATCRLWTASDGYGRLWTPKLYFYTNFIRIFLDNFIQNSLYTVFTQSKFTTIILTKTM